MTLKYTIQNYMLVSLYSTL